MSNLALSRNELQSKGNRLLSQKNSFEQVSTSCSGHMGTKSMNRLTHTHD